MTRIPRRLLQHRDIKPSLAQPPPKLRSIIERNAQQHALAGKNRNLAPIHPIVVRRNRLGIPQHQIQLRRPRQRFAVFLRTLLRLKKREARLRVGLLARVIVKLNPPVPPLRTNLANPLQERLNLVVLFPEPREAVPLIDIDTRKKIGDIHHGGRSAFGEHLRKSFSANEIAGQTVCQISVISAVTHVRRDGGAVVCRARRFALEEFHCDPTTLNSSVSGRLRFAGQVKYRSYLTETKQDRCRQGRKNRRRPALQGRRHLMLQRQPTESTMCNIVDKVTAAFWAALIPIPATGRGL